MIFKAVLSDPDHPEHGQYTVPFPIPDGEYAHTVGALAELGVGDAVRRDCMLEELDTDYPVLRRMERGTVNLDELDYLAKRLDSFCAGDDLQFLAMADKLGLTDMTDFINLTFCCQQATVISDFSKLEDAGKDHLMNLNGGCMPIDQFEKADGKTIALALIHCGEGQITPYGVVYDNGMKLEPLYTGKTFPAYLYDAYSLVLAVTPKDSPEDTEDITYLYLPSAHEQLDRALQRGGISSYEEAQVKLDWDDLPDGVREVVPALNETLEDLNRMCGALKSLDRGFREKLNAVVTFAKPTSAAEVTRLIEGLELFEVIPGVQTPAGYGKYLIQESGYYSFDPNLEDYYDYRKCGQEQMDSETGWFVKDGYVSYHGKISLDELLGRTQAPTMEMGGMA